VCVWVVVSGGYGIRFDGPCLIVATDERNYVTSGYTNY